MINEDKRKELRLIGKVVDESNDFARYRLLEKLYEDAGSTPYQDLLSLVEHNKSLLHRLIDLMAEGGGDMRLLDFTRRGDVGSKDDRYQGSKYWLTSQGTTIIQSIKSLSHNSNAIVTPLTKQDFEMIYQALDVFTNKATSNAFIEENELEAVIPVLMPESARNSMLHEVSTRSRQLRQNINDVLLKLQKASKREDFEENIKGVNKFIKQFQDHVDAFKPYFDYSLMEKMNSYIQKLEAYIDKEKKRSVIPFQRIDNAINTLYEDVSRFSEDNRMEKRVQIMIKEYNSYEGFRSVRDNFIEIQGTIDKINEYRKKAELKFNEQDDGEELQEKLKAFILNSETLNEEERLNEVKRLIRTYSRTAPATYISASGENIKFNGNVINVDLTKKNCEALEPPKPLTDKEIEEENEKKELEEVTEQIRSVELQLQIFEKQPENRLNLDNISGKELEENEFKLIQDIIDTQEEITNLAKDDVFITDKYGEVYKLEIDENGKENKNFTMKSIIQIGKVERYAEYTQYNDGRKIVSITCDIEKLREIHSQLIQERRDLSKE